MFIMYKRVISLLLTIVTFIAITFMIAMPVSATEDMHISEQGIAYLKKAEGFSKYPYWDASQWTVGYGTRCPDNKLEEYKKNGFKVNKLGDFPLKLETKPEGI